MAEARANPIRPVINTRLRSNMSPSRPPTGSRLPKASAYAVTTHCRSLFGNARARCADGSAMFTIVASRTTMSWAIATTTRTSQRRSSGAAGLAAGTGDVTEDMSPLIPRLVMTTTAAGDHGLERHFAHNPRLAVYRTRSALRAVKTWNASGAS